MKTLIFCISILCSFSIQAQQELPIFSESNFWQIKFSGYDGTNYWEQYQPLGILGDTMINGQIYKIIGNPNWPNTIYGFGYDQNNKTYFRPYEDAPDDDILLYDFNLNLGDTFTLYAPYQVIDSSLLQIEVLDIDSVELEDGSKRKRYTFMDLFGLDLPYDLCSNGVYWTWIDGIGSDFHPLWAIQYCFESGPTIDCYAYQGEEVYGDCLYSPIEEVNSSEVNLFPNPFTSEINILDSDRRIESFTLYNIDGIIIQESNQRSKVSNLEHLPHGLYFMKITTVDNSEKIFKLVK